MLSSRQLLGASRRSAPLVLLLGCSGTDVGYPRVSETPSCPEIFAPEAGGGAASAPMAGAPSSASGAPSPSGGNDLGGSATGGASAAGTPGVAGAISMGGTPATTPFEWPAAFEPSMSPSPADGQHNAGTGCMSSSCHGGKVPFLFGGTVYQADGKTGAPNVQVGISDGTLTLTAYSASNGNIWLPSSAGQLDMANAQIAIRNTNGERVKPATAGRGAACNGGGCHGSALRLIAP